MSGASGMTDIKILKVLWKYECELSADGTTPQRVAINELKDAHTNADKVVRAHALYMIHEMRIFLVEGRREKLMRWLGFLQGVLWMGNYYTLEELANHNRPDVPEEGEPK